jgi:hypothetical protein
MLVPEHSCCPGWSHDGTRVSVPASAPDGRITTATVNADGTGFNPFGLPDATLNIGCAGGGWAPGDATIACQAWDETDALRNGIYTVSSADGSGVTRLTDPQGGEDDVGGYSPDGSQLVFLRFDAQGNPLGQFIVPASGGEPRRLTPAGMIFQSGNAADWSPLGDELVFSRHVTSGVRGSLWIHPDGTGLRELHVQGMACGGPLPSPRGDATSRAGRPTGAS